ncbi:MAG TPA: PA14 domain-containing protein, partial [Pirellulales bacterium]|nr:PA14 domain-containing protein [Pirellulales bacterium]
MDASFDPYHKWLGIRSDERPPNYYQLLGLPLFEGDPETIGHAADQRIAYVRTLAANEYVDVSQHVLNELAAAKVCLLDAAKRAAYDAKLKRGTRRATPPPVARSMAAPATIDVATAPAFDQPPLVLRRRPSSKRTPSAASTWAMVAGGLLAVACLAGVLVYATSNSGDQELASVPRAAGGTTGAAPSIAEPPGPEHSGTVPGQIVSATTEQDKTETENGESTTRPGLVRQWFEGENFEGSATDSVVSTAALSAAPEGTAGPFSVRWTGYLRPQVAGRYKLGLRRSPGGVRLALDGRWLVDETDIMRVGSPTLRFVFDLDDQPHRLQLELFGPDASQCAFELLWECKGAFAETAVPDEVFSHREVADDELPLVPVDPQREAERLVLGRRLAHWVIARGGEIWQRDSNGRSKPWTRDETAIDDASLLVGAHFRGVPLAADDLRQLGELPSFSQLRLGGVSASDA